METTTTEIVPELTWKQRVKAATQVNRWRAATAATIVVAGALVYVARHTNTPSES